MLDNYVDKLETASRLYVLYRDKNGFCHRTDGPARVWLKGNPYYPEGHQEWYIHGEKIPVNSQQEFEKYLQLKAFW